MPFVFKLLTRNALRQKLRVTLTMVGLVVAICAFGFLRTMIDAWYMGVNASSSARLITRNAISLTFSLPLHYGARIRQVRGVSGLSWANWFGGVYISERNFFPQFAVDAASYLDLYPEYRISPEQKRAFLTDRKGAMVGRKLAEQYGWKIGDQIPLRGTVYAGTWTFTVRAIYDGAEANTDTQQFLFHWDYLNETAKRNKIYPRDMVGIYVVQLADPTGAAEIAQAVDALFKNSLAETLSETEKAFQLGFVAMSEAILTGIRAVSLVIILIIMAVMANTIAMTARERVSEYATLKALGFSPGFIARLIVGESLLIALAGGLLGIALSFPLVDAFSKAVGTFFPVFVISSETIVLQIAASFLIGLIAALVPAWRAARVGIVQGLRQIG